MKRVEYIALLFVCLFSFVVATAAEQDDNVYVRTYEAVYRLKPAKDGTLDKVKIAETYNYSARRVADTGIAATGYGEHISLDKASAPDAKPLYVRSDEIDDDVFYADSRMCLLKFPVKPGKDSRVVFERTVNDPAQFCEINLAPIFDTDEATVRIEVPSELAGTMKFSPRNLPLTASYDTISDKNGNLTITYRCEAQKGREHEALEAPAAYIAPEILVTGYFADVADLYRHFNQFINEDDGHTNAEVAKIANQAIAGLNSEIDRCNAIATWVRRNIRYVAIEHGEYAYRPDHPTEVLRKRYADCKGSAALIRAMLRSVGIDGRLAWIGTHPDVVTRWEDVPTLGSGNHMIAAAVLPDTVLFIDGTSTYAGAGLLPLSIRGQQAIVEGRGEGDFLLLDVPRLPAGTDRMVLEADYTLTPDNKISGPMAYKSYGAAASATESLYAEANAAKRNDILTRVLRAGKKNVEVSQPEFFRDRPDAYPAVIRGVVTNSSALKRASGRRLVTLDVLPPIEPEVVDTVGRRTPVMLSHPCEAEAVITLATGVAPDKIKLPADVAFDDPWFDGEITYSVDPQGQVSVRSRIYSRRCDASIEELPAWNEAVRRVMRASTATITISD